MTKTPKILALYTPIAPPPFIYIYQCNHCRYFIEPNDCSIVCRKGQPDNNIISPTAWCRLLVNKQEEKPFDWIIKKKQNEKEG